MEWQEARLNPALGSKIGEKELQSELSHWGTMERAEMINKVCSRCLAGHRGH